MTERIRALRESDDRSQFQSGDHDLDRFLHQFAGQNQFRHHLGTTYVAIEAGRVVGYATVAAAHLSLEDLPAQARHHLPAYPLPVLRLARLATDQRWRGRGLGQALLRHVFMLALRMAQEVGCIGVVVDAKRDAVAFYGRLCFMPLEVVEGSLASRPQPQPMFLPLADLEKAQP